MKRISTMLCMLAAALSLAALAPSTRAQQVPLQDKPFTGHTIVLPGAGADTLAWLALHDGQLFLQPAAGREPPLCNGAPVARPTWLHAGHIVDGARGWRSKLCGDMTTSGLRIGRSA